MKEWERMLRHVTASADVQRWFQTHARPLTQHLQPCGWQDPCLLAFLQQLPVDFELEPHCQRARYLSAFVTWWVSRV